MTKIARWTRNVLIVEDDLEIADWYKDYVEEGGGYPWVAHSAESSAALVEEVAFGVALVDLSLSKEDDANRDGLRVLELIAKAGDGTRTTLITGRGDFKGARDALVRYGAVEAFDKDEVGDELLSKHVPGEIKAAAALWQRSEGMRAYVLKPEGSPVWEWESKIQSLCKPRGGIAGLYEFWDHFLPALMPLIPMELERPLGVGGDDLVAGVFWSRARGCALRVGLTRSEKAEALEKELRSGSSFPGKVAGELEIIERSGVTGALLPTADLDRRDFPA